MRGIIGELKTQGDAITIVDMEAGLELFGRGTPGASDLLVIVVEPSLWSIQTAVRVAELGSELGIPKLVAVLNKVRDEGDVTWISEMLQPKGVDVIGVVPYDPDVSLADRKMRSLLDIAPASRAARAISDLVDRIEATLGLPRPASTAAPAPAISGEASIADDGCPWVVDHYR